MYKEHSKNFNLMKMYIETMRNNQSEMKNKIPKMKTTLEEINNNRLNYSMDLINEFEDKVAENT